SAQQATSVPASRKSITQRCGYGQNARTPPHLLPIPSHPPPYSLRRWFYLTHFALGFTIRTPRCWFLRRLTRVYFALRMTHDITDITIIGGGPTGLFASFYTGMRGATAQIVDALPQLGGQLTALYPEKYIFDVGGFAKILAKDLVKALKEQVDQFHHKAHLNQNVVALERNEDRFVLVTETDRFPTRAIVIAGGIGAFSPRRLPQQCAEPWYGRGIFDRVSDPEEFRGQSIVIIGGGDSAF